MLVDAGHPSVQEARRWQTSGKPRAAQRCTVQPRGSATRSRSPAGRCCGWRLVRVAAPVRAIAGRPPPTFDTGRRDASGNGLGVVSGLRRSHRSDSHGVAISGRPARGGPVVRRFDIEVGHCSRSQRRVQGRHALQTSDALGAAGASSRWSGCGRETGWPGPRSDPYVRVNAESRHLRKAPEPQDRSARRWAVCGRPSSHQSDPRASWEDGGTASIPMAADFLSVRLQSTT